MKKIILLVLTLFVFPVICIAGPDVYTGIDAGGFESFKNIYIASETHTCIISTGNMITRRGTGLVVKSADSNSSNIQLSTSPVFVDCVALYTSSNNAVFTQGITTTTLIAATSVWTTGITNRNIYNNVTVVAEFGKWSSTAVVKGTVTVSGLDENGNWTHETFTSFSTTSVTGSKVWVDISTISVIISTDTHVGNISVGAVPNPIIVKVGAGSVATRHAQGNIIELSPGDSVPVSATKYNPVFARVKRTGNPCIIYLINMREE